MHIVRWSADCSPSGPFLVIWMVDRWAGLARRQQIYCFHRFECFIIVYGTQLLVDIRMQYDLGGYFLSFSSMSKVVAALIYSVYSMFISNSSSVNIVRRSEIVHRADFYLSFGMVDTDRWAGLANRWQIYCFSQFYFTFTFLNVLSMFRVYRSIY